MAAIHHLTTVLFCIAATAGTYLVMHLVVAPRLPTMVVDVPPLRGLSIEQARALMDPRGLFLVIDGERVPEGDNVAPGTLFDQHPLGGSRLRPGEKVHASLARAAPPLRVPTLVGQPLEEARRALQEQGLAAGPITEVEVAGVPAGAVARTDPPAGAEVQRERPIALFVSKAGEQVTVPNLRGRSLRVAQKLLEQAGLQLGEQHKGVDDNADDGVVLRQNPAAGMVIARGQKVDVIVNE